MKISKADLRDITQEAECAFWEVLVKRFPQAQTGDLSIDRTIRLSIAAQEAVEEWIENNVTTATSYLVSTIPVPDDQLIEVQLESPSATQGEEP